MPSFHTAGPLSADQARLLDEAVLRLDALSDLRMVIRLVEKWGENGRPSSRARLAQARAFLELRLMDRAWVRLKELADHLGDDQALLALTAVMFIERGWPVRARKAVNTALTKDPANPRLHDLLRRSHQPPIQPPSNAREIERTGSPAELLKLAERFLCAGSFLRARSILEKLRRQKGSWNGRVEDLLWGLVGDFTTGVDDPLAVAHAVLSTAPLSEIGDLTDHSEVTAHGDASVQDHEEIAFPSLFRRVEKKDGWTETSDITGEVTRISRMADASEAAAVLGSDTTDSGEWSDDLPMDTQFQVVVGRDPNAPMHRKVEKEGAYDLKKSLDLREYQATMGMGDLGADLSAPDFTTADSDLAQFLVEGESPEEEDDDLIVMTRREPDPSELPEEIEVPSGPIEVIERPLGPVRTVPPPPVRSPEPVPPPVRSPRRESLGRASKAPNPVLLVGVGAIFLLLLFFLSSKLYGRWLSQEAWSDTAIVLAQGSYRELLQEEVRLEALLKNYEEPRGTYLAAYAVLEQVLYEEFMGGEPRLLAAQETFLEAADVGGASEFVALAAAWRAHLLGEGGTALAMLGQLGDDTAEVLYLTSLVELDAGLLLPAMESAQAAVDASPGSPRYQLGLARACQKAGNQDCVQRAFAEAAQTGPTLASVRLASIDFGGGDAVERLGSLERFLGVTGLVAPRHQGRALTLSADLYLQLEDADAARRALAKALAADPDNPGLLVRVASIRLASNQPKLALADAMRCLGLKPSDMACHRASIHALLALDRIDQAVNAVSSVPVSLSDHPELHLLGAWIAATGSQEPESIRTHLSAYLQAGGTEDGEYEYLQATAFSLEDPPHKGVAQLERASALLAQETDPLLRRLAPRALAFGAYRLGAIDGRRLAVEALRGGSEDAWVHVQLGRLEDIAGNRKDASRHFDRAVLLCPELAIAHYHRGVFYLDDRRRGAQKQTWGSWALYLALDPSGPRAERALRHLGY
jgi:tetratricopeptide (TPR) repeat protein